MTAPKVPKLIADARNRGESTERLSIKQRWTHHWAIPEMEVAKLDQQPSLSVSAGVQWLLARLQ